MQVLRQPGASLTAQEDTDSRQQAFQPFRPTSMGTDQSRETFGEHAAATGRILATKPSHHQLNVGGGPHCQDTKSKVSKLQSLLSDRDMRLWWIDMHRLESQVVV